MPRETEKSLTAFPADDEWVSFRIAKNHFLANLDSGEIVRWELAPEADVEIVLEDDAVLLGNDLVSRSGKQYALEFDLPENQFPGDLRLIETPQQLVWEITYAQQDEDKGIWTRAVENGSESSKFSSFGWDPIWSLDGQTVWFCSGRGLEVFRVGESEPTPLYEQQEEVVVRNPQLSPDGTALVIQVNDRNRGIKSVDRIVAISLEGVASELFETPVGGGAEDPVWSPDGTKIAFRYTPPRHEEYPVTTLAVVGAEKESPALILKQFERGAFLVPAGVQSFAWSPQSDRLAFLGSFRGATILDNEAGDKSHKFDLCLINADGTGLRRFTKIDQEAARFNSGPVIWW